MSPTDRPTQALQREQGGHAQGLPKVVHVSTYDHAGGAARATYRLHAGLRQRGVDSTLFVRDAITTDASTVRFEPTNAFLGRVERRVRREYIQRRLGPSMHVASDRFEPFRIDRSEYGSDVVVQLPPHHILNLHWIADFVDYRAFFQSVPTTTPIVWTLHDMNAFTGGCHYDLGCGRYRSHCGECPQLRRSGPHDLSRNIWQRKKALFDGLPLNRLHLVAPSAWLADEVAHSPLLGRFPVSVIPYGLDLTVFMPRDRRSGRAVFGVPQDAMVVLFVADGLPLIRKGFEILIEALEQIKSRIPDICLVGVGHNSPTIGARLPHVSVGPIKSDRLLSHLYSAADVLVVPSVQDNFPNTVLEAMACGTPTVGFAVGGIPEMIQHDQTGFLVQPQQPSDLGAAVLQLLRNRELPAIREQCRRTALQQFSLEQQATCYAELYRRLLSRPL